MNEVGRYHAVMGLRAAISRCTAKTATEDHPALIDKLRLQRPHQIMHRQRGDEHVNCYMFVMDIEPFGQVCYLLQMPDLKLGNDPFPGYVSYLLQECVLEEVPCGVVTPGHWALYFCRGALVHAALLLPGERFLSKWGQGHVWEHGKWEVPVTYGDDVKFFKPLSRGALWGLAHLYSATLPGAPEWLIDQAVAILADGGNA